MACIVVCVCMYVCTYVCLCMYTYTCVYKSMAIVFIIIIHSGYLSLLVH